MRETHLSRRAFIGSSLAAGLAASQTNAQTDNRSLDRPGSGHRGPCVIASGNGMPAVATAWDLLNAGADTADAVVQGVGEVEKDPTDTSVGLGGLPNEQGVVQLDASVMHGPTHKAGAVGCIEDILHPAQVALGVLRRTDHVMLVGRGAKDFALAMGHEETNLLTDEAREAWLRWKALLNPDDDWLDPHEFVGPRADEHSRAAPVPFTYGTINCSAVNADGDLSSCTTTSGLSYKIPGRVGDSPIVGAGMYVDNAVGAAGATGRGEAVIQNCGAFSVVERMRAGDDPTEACINVLKRIADNTKQKRLLTAGGTPNFNVTLYALRKDGAYGSGCMLKGGSFAVRDAQHHRVVPSEWLFDG
jgi:N4-(beta-N-acetylglucosaminyl)-L-asparaginase